MLKFPKEIIASNDSIKCLKDWKENGRKKNFQKSSLSKRNGITHILAREISLLISSHSNMTRKRTQFRFQAAKASINRACLLRTIRSPDELIRDTRIHSLSAARGRIMHFHDPNNSNDFRRLVDRRKIGFAQQRDTFQENLPRICYLNWKKERRGRRRRREKEISSTNRHFWQTQREIIELFVTNFCFSIDGVVT